MKVLLEIRDDKAQDFMKTIRSLKYIKAIRLTRKKALLLKEMKEAVDELNLVKKGKKRARNAETFLNEL
jgi:hypothetical protein